jgi:hypothetical protein
MFEKLANITMKSDLVQTLEKNISQVFKGDFIYKKLEYSFQNKSMKTDFILRSNLIQQNTSG